MSREVLDEALADVEAKLRAVREAEIGLRVVSRALGKARENAVRILEPYVHASIEAYNASIEQKRIATDSGLYIRVDNATRVVSVIFDYYRPPFEERVDEIPAMSPGEEDRVSKFLTAELTRRFKEANLDLTVGAVEYDNM